MQKLRKSGELLIGLLLLAITCFVLMPIKAPAKSAADAAAAINGVNLYNQEGINILAVEKDGITVEGYDLSGYSVLIKANNVTVKNCTNIMFVNIHPNLSGVKFTGNTIVGPYATGVTILSDNVEISNNTITGTTNFGIYAENRKGCTISGNTVSGNAGLYSIIIKNCSNMTISGNTIKDSALDALRIEGDNGSVISKNTLLNSAAAGWTSSGHGEGLIIDANCKGTQVIENTVDGVKSGKAGYGNGIMVANSTDITVKSNTVTNIGNHGLQASYNAKNVVFENNTITKANNDGISISRGAEADCIDNKIHDNVGQGIVYDGHEGATTGTVKGNEVYSNTEFGILLSGGTFTVADNKVGNNGSEGIRAVEASSGTISGNTVYDNASTVGMQFFTGTTFKVSNNHVYKSSNDDAGYGILVNSGANVEATGNRVHNYATCAIFASETSTFKASGNQATISGTNNFKGNAYIKANDTFQNTLIFEVLGGDTFVGQTYFAGYKSGVVIKGTVYQTTSDDKGKIKINYPLVDSINDVTMFTVDNNGNSIVLNAGTDFVLNLDGAQNTNNSGNEAQVKEFVKRFYVTILQRPYDDKGLSDWANVLLSKQLTASEVAHGFVFSDEFVDKGYNNEEFVARMYAAFFGRDAAADPAGANTWISALNEGYSRDFVFAGFVNSDEFRNICAEYGMEAGSYDPSGAPQNPQPQQQQQPQNPQPSQTQSGIRIDASGVDPAKLDEFMERLYNEALGRPSDPQGKQDWANAIISGQFDAGTVARYGFFASDEYVNKGKSNEEFVHDAYRAFFGRDEDQGGYDMWVKALYDGTYTRDQVIEAGFGYSDEFIGLLESYGFKVYR